MGEFRCRLCYELLTTIPEETMEASIKHLLEKHPEVFEAFLQFMVREEK